mgnify:CR=1 FL=1
MRRQKNREGARLLCNRPVRAGRDGCRCIHRRLYRLPAAPRCSQGVLDRRGVWPARLEPTEDPRVKCMERTNIRYVTPDMLEETPSFCVIDVSFISLKLVLPVVSGLLTADGRVACLIKPQFEAGKGKVGKKAWCASRRSILRCLSGSSRTRMKRALRCRT